MNRRCEANQIERVAQEICRRREQDPFEIVGGHDAPEDARELWTYYLDDAAAYVAAAREPDPWLGQREKSEAQEWTPGPWRSTHSDPAEGADVWWITAGDGNKETDIGTISGGKWPIGKSTANAQLISAAPMLYDTLSTMAFQIRVSFNAICDAGVGEQHTAALRYVLASADAAIDKARGR